MLFDKRQIHGITRLGFVSKASEAKLLTQPQSYSKILICVLINKSLYTCSPCWKKITELCEIKSKIFF